MKPSPDFVVWCAVTDLTSSPWFLSMELLITTWCMERGQRLVRLVHACGWLLFRMGAMQLQTTQHASCQSQRQLHWVPLLLQPRCQPSNLLLQLRRHFPNLALNNCWPDSEETLSAVQRLKREICMQKQTLYNGKPANQRDRPSPAVSHKNSNAHRKDDNDPKRIKYKLHKQLRGHFAHANLQGQFSRGSKPAVAPFWGPWQRCSCSSASLIDAVKGCVAVQATQVRLHWIAAQHTHEGRALLLTDSK